MLTIGRRIQEAGPTLHSWTEGRGRRPSAPGLGSLVFEFEFQLQGTGPYEQFGCNTNGPSQGACIHLGLLGPVEAGRLHGGLAGVAELLLPARVDLVGVLLEGEEGTLDLLVGLGELDDAIAQADVAVLS